MTLYRAGLGSALDLFHAPAYTAPPWGVHPLVLTIHDVSGRRLVTLLHGPLGAGWRSTIWDGRTDTGRAVASGVYFVHLQGAGDARTRKLVRLD